MLLLLNKFQKCLQFSEMLMLVWLKCCVGFIDFVNRGSASKHVLASQIFALILSPDSSELIKLSSHSVCTVIDNFVDYIFTFCLNRYISGCRYNQNEGKIFKIFGLDKTLDYLCYFNIFLFLI